MVQSKLIVGTDLYMPETGELFTPEAEEIRLQKLFASLGLRLKDNFYVYLDFYDIVEVLLPTGVQIYSNGRFFQLTSIPMEELLSKPFDELYDRSADIQMQLMQYFQMVFSHQSGKVVQIDVPQHTLREKSGERRLISDKPKYACPIFNEHDQIIAGVLSHEAEVARRPTLRKLPD